MPDRGEKLQKSALLHFRLSIKFSHKNKHVFPAESDFGFPFLITPLGDAEDTIMRPERRTFKSVIIPQVIIRSARLEN